jgi:hypothetical protein
MNTRTEYREKRTGLHRHFIGSLIFHVIVLALLLSVPLHTGGAGAELIHLVFLDTGETGIPAVSAQKSLRVEGKPAGLRGRTEKNGQDTLLLKESPSGQGEGMEKTVSEVAEAPEIKESLPEASVAEPESMPETEDGRVSDSVDVNVASSVSFKDVESAYSGPDFEEQQAVQTVKEDAASVDLKKPEAITDSAVENISVDEKDQPIVALPESASEPEQTKETASKPVEPAAESSRGPSSDFLQKILPLIQEPSFTGADPETALKIKDADADPGLQKTAKTTTAELAESDKDRPYRNNDTSSKVAKAEPKPEKKRLAKDIQSDSSGTKTMDSGKLDVKSKITMAGLDHTLMPDLLRGGFRPGSDIQEKGSETSLAKTSGSVAGGFLTEGSTEKSGIKEAGPESRDDSASGTAGTVFRDNDKPFKNIPANAGGAGKEAAGPAEPEINHTITGTHQDSQPEKIGGVGIKVSEALIRKDIKIVVIAKSPNASVVMGLFRRSAVMRQRRTETFRQEAVPAMLEKTNANINNRPGLKHLVGVPSAEKGIYTFVLMNKDEEPHAVHVVFHLFEGKAAERVKEYSISELPPGGRMEFKFVLPDALFWDDEERFSGSIEDSSTTTKFQYDSGLVWKEKKGLAVSGNEEFIREENFLISGDTL